MRRISYKEGLKSEKLQKYMIRKRDLVYESGLVVMKKRGLIRQLNLGEITVKEFVEECNKLGRE